MIEVKKSETDKKPISEMSEKEILRQQLELLAERSIFCTDDILPKTSEVMLSIACYLSSSDSSHYHFVPEDSNGKHMESSEKMQDPFHVS